MIRPLEECTYRETFDDGPGGWIGWESNALGAKPLEVRDGIAISRSPWWIDYNHAPPGGGYLHLPFCLFTRMLPSDPPQYVECGGRNRFIEAGCPTDFTNARLTVRLQGDVQTRGAHLMLLVQAHLGSRAVNHVLTGQPFQITPEWSEQSVVLRPDPDQWTCLGSRHDRTDDYGWGHVADVLRDVNRDIILVLFPLTIVPLTDLNGQVHQLKAGEDYEVDRTRLPEGTLMLDEVRIEFAAR